MPLVSPFETSFGRIDTRDCIIIEAKADGMTGFGECAADRDPGYSYETADTACHILQDFLVPTMLSQIIADASEMQTRMAAIRGHPMAKAGLEMAFWDLLGKNQRRSLGELIGSVRQQVAVGVSVGIQASPQALVDVVSGYLSQGYRRVKIKIKPGRDVPETLADRARELAVLLEPLAGEGDRAVERLAGMAAWIEGRR